jgi:hypothetical protein
VENGLLGLGDSSEAIGAIFLVVEMAKLGPTEKK